MNRVLFAALALSSGCLYVDNHELTTKEAALASCGPSYYCECRTEYLHDQAHLTLEQIAGDAATTAQLQAACDWCNSQGVVCNFAK